jgi:hypothetical protein
MYSTQVERLGVVETGRRRRWTDDEKLKIVVGSMQAPRDDLVDGAAVRSLALAFAELATIVLVDELAAAETATTKVALSRASDRPAIRSRIICPRERLSIPGPVACACCDGARLSRLGEDITETRRSFPNPGK